MRKPLTTGARGNTEETEAPTQHLIFFDSTWRTLRLGGGIAAASCEHFRIWLGVELAVQAADYFGSIVFFDHERQVNF